MHFDPCDTRDSDPIAQAERLISQGEAGRAAALLRRWRDAGRGGLLTDLLLVRALIAAGEGGSALEVAREARLAHPNAASAVLALGNAFANVGDLPLAIAEFQRALRAEPSDAAARVALGEAWLEAGEPERALEAFAHLDEKEFPHLGRLVMRAKAMHTQTRADAGYVRHLFDQFSANYDARMRRELSYAAPEILKDLADLVMPGRRELSILDLGCGTGLAGAAFKPLAARLDGIDLSPNMIDQARTRRIYDELTVGDIEQMRPECVRKYDLVLAADTFVYLGELSKVMKNTANQLRPGGMLLFTVEKDDGRDFSLGPKRRWRHSPSYLREEAERRGFAIAGLLDCVPRKEAGKPVAGLAAALECVHRDAKT
jgi:predicted TPR repeat methyltransferase